MLAEKILDHCFPDIKKAIDGAKGNNLWESEEDL